MIVRLTPIKSVPLTSLINGNVCFKRIKAELQPNPENILQQMFRRTDGQRTCRAYLKTSSSRYSLLPALYTPSVVSALSTNASCVPSLCRVRTDTPVAWSTESRASTCAQTRLVGMSPSLRAKNSGPGKWVSVTAAVVRLLHRLHASSIF